MENLLDHCTLCPRRCGVNRNAGARGFCSAGATVCVARTMLHRWEEPCLVGAHGAGAVFFAHCTLRCVYCQNHEISHDGKGTEMDEEELATCFLALERKGAATLDLVTPTHYTPQILSALTLARARGLNLPVVWNTSGYETVENIARLAGAVDIYLPDLKYDTEESGRLYSAAPNYTAAAWCALAAMVAQVGAVRFGRDGQLLCGVLVRHLVLPGHRRESIALVKRLWAEFGDAIQLSLMRQYTPLYRAAEFPPLHRRLTTFEYESIVDAAREIGMTRVYVQGAEAVGEEYVPEFT
ncbi:radical SAM protein [Selenomonas timonae]|uniref:Radical SAM protein n=1 Tax=Selenomonas timonae TaxID=2754044 RepID=A0A7G7VLZ2_9FIRM|nr:radical SAM protein [Selenomonas timonae]QNH55135.1 radical SAM protein [Selenomonas timonae]